MDGSPFACGCHRPRASDIRLPFIQNGNATVQRCPCRSGRPEMTGTLTPAAYSPAPIADEVFSLLVSARAAHFEKAGCDSTLWSSPGRLDIGFPCISGRRPSVMASPQAPSPLAIALPPSPCRGPQQDGTCCPRRYRRLKSAHKPCLLGDHSRAAILPTSRQHVPSVGVAPARVSGHEEITLFSHPSGLTTPLCRFHPRP